MASGNNDDPLADLEGFARQQPERFPVWEANMSEVRSHLVGHEESFIRAVDAHGFKRVAEYLSETVAKVSRATIYRIYSDIKTDGRIKVPGRNKGARKKMSPRYDSGDIYQKAFSNPDRAGCSGNTPKSVISSASQTEDPACDSEASTYMSVDFIGGRSVRNSLERAPSSGRISRQEQQDKVMQKIIEDANGGNK